MNRRGISDNHLFWTYCRFHWNTFYSTEIFSWWQQTRCQYHRESSWLHRASIVSNTLFIIPNVAHNYKIIGMLKTIKIPTVAPTCFRSRRNHHQGDISCLAKTTIMILSYSSLMTWSTIWRHISLLCNHEDSLWYWHRVCCHHENISVE